MSVQLRADIAQALAVACEQVKTYELGSPNLIHSVTRLIDGALRFVDQNGNIRQDRRTLILQIESTVQLADRGSHLDILSNGEGRSYPEIQTARAHTIRAVNGFQATILTHCLINAAGDRVGLGKEGDPLR